MVLQTIKVWFDNDEYSDDDYHKILVRFIAFHCSLCFWLPYLWESVAFCGSDASRTSDTLNKWPLLRPTKINTTTLFRNLFAKPQD